MAEMRRIRFYKADDWVWVFADDRCVFSGHSISGDELLRALEYEDFSVHYEREDNDDEALWSVDDTALHRFPTELFED